MQHQFALNSQALECFVKNMPQPAYINSVETGEFLFGNQSGFGCVNSQLTNKALLISRIAQQESKAIQEKYLFSEKEMDAQLLSTGNVITNENCWEFDDAGKICFFTIVKIPVIDNEEKISAILTMRLKSDQAIQPVELYQLYKTIAKSKKIAIEKTMDHLGVNIYFQESLTDKELTCLLQMKIDTSHKYLMSKLFVSKKTIESHVSNLIKKSIAQNLSDVLAYLRTIAI